MSNYRIKLYFILRICNTSKSNTYGSESTPFQGHPNEQFWPSKEDKEQVLDYSNEKYYDFDLVSCTKSFIEY